MEPIDYRGALARGWRLMAVLGLIGLLLGLLLPAGGTTQWKATSQVGALPADTLGGAGSSPLSTGVPTDQIIFYASSDQVLAAAGKQADLNTNTAVLRDRVSFVGPTTNSNGQPVGVSGVVTVSSTGPSQANAVDLNRAFVIQLGKKVNEEATQQLRAQQIQVFSSILAVTKQLNGLTDQAGVTATAYESELTALETRQAQLATETPYTGYTILELASHATQTKLPIIDSRAVRGLIGLLVGVLLGAALALLVSLFDKRLRSATRAKAVFGYSVVTEIHHHSVRSTEEFRMLALAVLHEPLAHRTHERGGSLDDIDIMYDRLDLVPAEATAGTAGALSAAAPRAELPAGPEKRQVVLVASPGSEPARAAVGADLATSCAESGRRVVVVSTGAIATDSDGAYTAPARVDPAQVAALLEDTSVPGVSVLPIQRLAAHSSQLLSVVPSVIESLRDLVDLVIFDVPPFLTVHHGEGLVPMVDAVVIVAEYRVTTSDQLRRTGDILQRLSAPVAGLVFANVPARSPEQEQPKSSIGEPEGSEDLLGGNSEHEPQFASVTTEPDATTAGPTGAPRLVPEEPMDNGGTNPQT